MWADEEDQAIVTALQILEEQEKAAASGKNTRQDAPGAGGPQYSG